MKRLLVGFGLLLLAVVVARPGTRAGASLDALQFLEGRWVGEGASEVGKGSGYASFERDLQGKVLVRRNHAEYPASEGKPPYVHDDLMIIYPDVKGGVRAFYTDNEGHVIHYGISIREGGAGATFLSDGDAPRYRLSYVQTGPGRMTILLETAAAEGAAFHKLVEGRMVKAAAQTAAKP